MGLFSKKEMCCICNINMGKVSIQDGFICKECLHLCNIPFQVKVDKNITKEMILNEIEENKNNKELIGMFAITKKIGNYIEFDENNRQWLIPDGVNGKKVNPKVYSYNDIVDYELLEDGESVIKGGIGKAVVGGFLFGGVGAIVGGIVGTKKTKSVINSLKLKITVNRTNNPSIYVNFINSSTKANSILYKVAYSSAQELLSMLAIIAKNNSDLQSDDNQNTISVADELIKLKSLVDCRILTEEEFETEKRKLLSK